MLAKEILEDDRADEQWLYEAVRELVNHAILDGREMTAGRLQVAPLADREGWFEVRARIGRSRSATWVRIMQMDELAFTFPSFLEALPESAKGDTPRGGWSGPSLDWDE